MRRNAVSTLPPEVKGWLDKHLVQGDFSGYALLEAELKTRGYQISKSALHRYGQKFERRLSAIKASTEAARMLTEGAADDQDARSEAVIALVQAELFESILNLQEASEEDIDPGERLGLLSAAAKNIATLSRASVNLKQYQAKVRAEDAEKLARMEGDAKSGKRRLDLETIKQIREELYGIV